MLYAPTQDERTFALLAHVMGIFSGFIAPLVFFLVKRDSKFVSFHALQALAWHIVYFILFFGAMVLFIVSLIAGGALHEQAHGPAPFAFFGFFGVFWLFALGGGILNMILAIVYGIKAHNGSGRNFRSLAAGFCERLSAVEFLF